MTVVFMNIFSFKLKLTSYYKLAMVLLLYTVKQKVKSALHLKNFGACGGPTFLKTSKPDLRITPRQQARNNSITGYP